MHRPDPDHPRAVTGGVRIQGPTESVVYALDVSAEGTGPTNPSVAVFSSADNYESDVSGDVLEAGAPTVQGEVITLPLMSGLTRGEKYRVDVSFTIDGNELTRFIPVYCD